jgi:hypothetical protein
MVSLVRASVLAMAALLVPAIALADDLSASGARVILKPGAAVRVPANRSAVLTGRISKCYLAVSGGAASVDFVLEAKDEARGVVLLPGEVLTNLGGTHVKGGTFPAVTCLVSMLLYAGGPSLASAPALK